MNSNKVLCGFFGLYPSYVAATLNTVQDTDFYVVCSEKFSHADYTEKCMANKTALFRMVEIFSRFVIKEK
jgi:hypothetical protein